jgi:hypothetical protein
LIASPDGQWTVARSDLARVMWPVAPSGNAADQHVVDFPWFDAGADDGVAHDMAAHRRAVRHVEGAAPALRESGACGGYDDGVGHGGLDGVNC